MGLGELITEAAQTVVNKRAMMSEASESKKQGRNTLIDRDEDDVKPMRQKMISYDKLVRRSIIDELPRYVGRWLLMELENEMLSRLQDSFLSEDGTTDLMCEPPEVELKRHGIKQELDDVHYTLSDARCRRRAARWWGGVRWRHGGGDGWRSGVGKDGIASSDNGNGARLVRGIPARTCTQRVRVERDVCMCQDKSFGVTFICHHVRRAAPGPPAGTLVDGSRERGTGEGTSTW
eukprot:7382992-Prymnesium_polylepis.2